MGTEQEKMAVGHKYEDRTPEQIVGDYSTDWVTVSRKQFLGEIEERNKLYEQLTNLVDALEIHHSNDLSEHVVYDFDNARNLLRSLSRG